MLSRHRARWVVTVVVLALGLPFARPAAARPTPTTFCSAVRAFSRTRPATTADLVAALRRLAKSTPPPARESVTAVLGAVAIGDPAAVVAEASAAPTPPASPLTLAGNTLTTTANQRCQVALDLRSAAPTGISKRTVGATTWTTTLCSRLSDWGHTVDDLGSKLVSQVNGPTTLAAVRSAVSDFVAGAVSTTQQLVFTLDAAGSAKVLRGLDFALLIHDGLIQAEQSFQAAQITAQALPDDARSFQTAGQALVQRLDATGKRVESLVRDAAARVQSRPLNRVLAATRACATVA